MAEIFMVSDTHFGDKGAIMRYEGRPFKSGREMDETLISNWNETVGGADTVYHLGDVAWNMEKEELKTLVGKLNGRKILIQGNHDMSYSVREWMEIGFEEVYPLPVVLEGFFMLSHEPMYVNSYSPYANIFGHVHGNPMYRDKSGHSFCACVERTNYRPVPFDKIKKEMSGCRTAEESMKQEGK
ncbi:metallophosphoesterase [uncultured Clostridium sp.]|uniref:metallophosphoesterase n=1 Tax=uncultured Clostridium sp. TaxID=59620 RepID=UPI0025DBEE05|nr:metallophosphoesterase [uncultured Clostridium sp.]